MIVHKKAAANPSTPRSPNILTVDSVEGWGPFGTDADSALKVSAVYRAINYAADTISIMPMYLMNRNTRERLTEHPLLQLLTVRPNEVMTPSEYKRRMEINRQMDGNSYAYINRDPWTGKVLELLPLSPNLVRPVMDVNYQLHYCFTDPKTGKIWDLLPCQLIHYKAFCRNGIEGISPLAYARTVIEKDQAAKTYEKALYRNGGRPSGVLMTDDDLSGDSDVTDDNGKPVSRKELVRRAWEKVYTGDNAFRTAVLDLGLKYEPVAMNNTDAQFVESNEITIADIARIFGTPMHVLMAGKQSYESNIQNRVEYVQTTAQAVVTAYEEEDSFKLLTESDQSKGLRIRRNMDAALRGDTKSRASFYQTMQQIGAYSVNDIEALEDRPDVPGGDVHLASLNYVPLEMLEDLARKKLEGNKNV